MVEKTFRIHLARRLPFASPLNFRTVTTDVIGQCLIRREYPWQRGVDFFVRTEDPRSSNWPPLQHILILVHDEDVAFAQVVSLHFVFFYWMVQS